MYVFVHCGCSSYMHTCIWMHMYILSAHHDRFVKVKYPAVHAQHMKALAFCSEVYAFKARPICILLICVVQDCRTVKLALHLSLTNQFRNASKSERLICRQGSIGSLCTVIFHFASHISLRRRVAFEMLIARQDCICYMMNLAAVNQTIR